MNHQNQLPFSEGDTVWVQSQEFIKETGIQEGEHYSHIGGAIDGLFFNNTMFKYCDAEAKIVFLTKYGPFIRYTLSNTNSHYWTPEMLTRVDPVGNPLEGIKEKIISHGFKEDLI